MFLTSAGGGTSVLAASGIPRRGSPGGDGGLDVLVFTAGIGEHAPSVRSAICEGLALTGLAIDPQRNAAG